MPEPPTQQPINPPNTQTITLTPDPYMISSDIDVLGAPGSAEPGSEIWAVNIDDTQPPVRTPVGQDGSFAFTLQGFTNDELRFQVRVGDRRSEPVDVLVPGEPGPAIPVVRALAACLSLDPAYELELPAPTGSEPPSAAIRIFNDCGAEVTIDAARLRVASEAFAIESPSLIPAGGSGSITVRAYGAPSEEVLLIQITSPDSDRVPVTLMSRGGVSGLLPSCEGLGGMCLSDPLDPTFPADCEALGQQTMQATCEFINTACCIAAP